jgi:hypothetical protein
VSKKEKHCSCKQEVPFGIMMNSVLNIELSNYVDNTECSESVSGSWMLWIISQQEMKYL